jgi:hypothetical protein
MRVGLLADPVGAQRDPSPTVEVDARRRRMGVDARLDGPQLRTDVERAGRDRRLAEVRGDQEAEVLRGLRRLGQHVEIGRQHQHGDTLRPAGRRVPGEGPQLSLPQGLRHRRHAPGEEPDLVRGEGRFAT